MTMYRGLRPAVLLLTLPLVAIGCNRQAEQEARVDEMPAAETQTAGARTETAITTDVQAKLYSDQLLRDKRIAVSTRGNTVTLRGVVATAEEQQRAATVARGVDGVQNVNNELTVDRVAENTSERERAVATSGGDYDPRNPGWITTKIQAQYFVNPELNPWRIDVTTSSDGVVELRGEVEDAEDKAEAVRIARQTEGVTRVDDRMRVQGTAESQAAGARAEADATADRDTFDFSDPWLTTKIQSKYFLDPDVKGHQIDVTTNSGVVTLEGTVESQRAKRQALAIARSTDGVMDVRDQLQVQPERETAAGRPADARADEARGTTGSATPIEDAWITTKVQSQYFLDADVKGHEINVDTRNGVVTLNGSVESQSARQLAEQIARETEGVTRVVNQLTVEPASRTEQPERQNPAQNQNRSETPGGQGQDQ